MFAGKKSAQIREILISESAWEEMTCLFAPSLDNETGVSMEKYIYFMCNKDVTLVLTDDYYFYFGLKQLTGLPLVYITYEGSMDKPIVIKQKRNIRVLVDSRIFYSGKWDGYKMLRKTLNMISQWMWLDISGGGEVLS
nr:Iron(III) dicitrate transport protein FecA [Klebsiella pneumoniae]